MDQLKDVFSPKAFLSHRHRTQSAQQPDLQLSLYGECLPSLAPPDRVNALLLEGDLAGYECRLHWASDGCAILASNEEGL